MSTNAREVALNRELKEFARKLRALVDQNRTDEALALVLKCQRQSRANPATTLKRRSRTGRVWAVQLELFEE
jgi:hypothetical protein